LEVGESSRAITFSIGCKFAIICSIEIREATVRFVTKKTERREGREGRESGTLTMGLLASKRRTIHP